jgi:hypothetical protein
MTPTKVFGVVVRGAGLGLLIYAVWYLLYGMVTILGMKGTQADWIAAYFLSGGFFFVVSLYLLRGAKRLVRFCYPKED